MSDTTQRDALERGMCARLGAFSHDELRVVDAIMLGLERGADTYGRLDLATDPRDWQREAAEERRDMAIYDACAMLSTRDAALAELHAAAAHELARREAGLDCMFDEIARVDAGEVTAPRPQISAVELGLDELRDADLESFDPLPFDLTENA